MAATLLEREREQAALDTLLGEITAGQGRIAVVSGEAGIGKTALVERFITHTPDSVRSLWGACEALFTPRPLGPLYDIAQRMRPAIRDSLDGDAKRAALFAAILDDLTSVPTILVIEDIHWADEATLDFIKYLARRITQTTTLLLLTYRDEELGRDHPLRLVLGDFPPRDVTRLRLLPLSGDAVTTLVQEAARPAKDVFLATRGNPFFVTEMLASDWPDLPTSVSDAVLARVARLSQDAQRLLDVVAVSPSRTEPWVVADLVAWEDAALDECVSAGLLHLDGRALAFRHELARQAVEGALSPTRRQTLNAQVLHALLESEVEPASLARLAHHAAGAEDSRLVLRFAPEAARQASAQGAHREAVAHYQTALRYADHLDAEERATLLDELTNELYLTGRMVEAETSGERALALWQALNQAEKVGYDLRRLSSIKWYLAKHEESERYAMMAVQLLETLPPSRELASAYATMSGNGMVKSDTAKATLWGMRALELAERLQDAQTISAALGNMGSSEMCAGHPGGQTKLERSLAIALEHGFERHVAVVYYNLADGSAKQRAYSQALQYIQQGLAYCAEHDLDLLHLNLRAYWARVRLEQGYWTEAADEVSAVLSVPWLSPLDRVIPLIVLGLVRLRHGDPDVETILDELRDVALSTTEMQSIAPMAAARAEWRWLQGDRDRCAAEAQVGVQAATRLTRPWHLGEVAIWYWRGGGVLDPADEVGEPYALEMAGDWRGAADVWEKIGCPYEQALALLEGDEAAIRTALGIFEQLGAAPAAEIVRKRLRQTGVRGLPRGPRPTTQANPKGLTNRQLEILLLMAEGLRNPEIAERLSTSLKTVEHHVSAVLAKLEVRSRAEAVHAAYELGLVQRPSQTHPATLRSPISNTAH